MTAPPPAPRPPHLIYPHEVADWLADSAVKTVTYHRTSPAAARAIEERGVRIERSRIGSYGQGSYSATESDVFYGDAEIPLAVRTRTPLEGDALRIANEVDRLARRLAPVGGITPFVAARIRRAFLADGYDAIVVRDAGGDGIDFVIALDEQAVKVVTT